MKVIFLLVFFWIFCTLFTIFSFDGSFGIISYLQSKNDSITYSPKVLTKWQKITGYFTARSNGLGIVQVHFAKIPQASFADEDLLQFSIKEVGQKNWYSQEIFQGNVIAHEPFFPFGFPIVPNSFGKRYIFQIESLRGGRQNAISISAIQPVFVTKYQALDSSTKANKKLLFLFFGKKIFNDMQIPDIFFASVVYALPLVFFLLKRYFDSLRSLRMTKDVALVILVGTSFVNIFIFQSPFLLVYISLTLVGLLGIFWKTFSEKKLLFVSFLFGTLFALFSLDYFRYASLVTGYTAYAFFGSILTYYLFYGVRVLVK